MNIDLYKTQSYLMWLKEKIHLDAISGSARKRTVYRGQVYRCKLGIGVGSEECKERPCVILQHDSANKTSPNTIIAPITHTESSIPSVIKIAEQKDASGKVILDGFVLLSNITCVSKARLGDYITKLPKDEIQIIDQAISNSLGIYHYYQKLQNIHNDKMEYIKKLKEIRFELQSKLDAQQSQINQFQALMKKYHFTDLNDLNDFIKRNTKFS